MFFLYIAREHTVIKHNKLTIALLMSFGMSVTPFSANAIQAGDIFVRGTITNVNPNDDSTGFTGAPGVFPEVEDSTTLGVTLVYMINSNLGFEILASLPFEHDITVAGLGTVGSAKQLPPTFSLQYYFNPASKFRPYVGAGLNYTLFFSEETIAGLGGDLSLDNSFGYAFQAGLDYDFNQRWFFNADIRYINIETTAKIAAVGSSDVDINPTVMSIGIGYKF